jgi:hypothetical protein
VRERELLGRRLTAVLEERVAWRSHLFQMREEGSLGNNTRVHEEASEE